MLVCIPFSKGLNLDNSAELSPNGNLTPFVATKVAYGKVGSKPIAFNYYYTHIFFAITAIINLKLMFYSS